MRFNKVMSAVLFASAFTIISCSQVDELDQQSPNSGKNIVEISVIDAGVYGDTPTRAIEDGYATTFEVGDAIGVYGIKGGAILVENKKFTLEEDGTWKVLGEPIQFVEEEMGETKFYAYYPYRPAGVKFNAGVGLANDPFAETVNSWNIGANLEGENYTQYDLMTSEVTDITPSGALGKVNFVLNHRMSIAAISLPGKIYNFQNTETTIDPYTLPATPGDFKVKQGAEVEKVVKPFYDKKNGLYRILVKPNVEYAISGTYILEKKKEYTSTRTAEQCIEGKATKFNIKGSSETLHTLQVGDYYCTDGSIVGKDEAAPDHAIGVVYFVGNPQPSVLYGESKYTEYKDIMRYDFPNCKHGLVIALESGKARINNSGATEKSETWKFSDSKGLYIDTWKNSYEEGDRYANVTSGGKIPPLIDMLGYNNTKIMKLSQSDDAIKGRSNIMCQVLNYYSTQTIIAPSLSTGWFCPSLGDLNTVLKDYEAINKSMVAAGSTLEQRVLNGDMSKDNGAYWTSSVRNESAQFISGLTTDEEDAKKGYAVTNNAGGTQQYFRFCLAF